MKAVFLTVAVFLALGFCSCGERLVPAQRLVEISTGGPIRGAYFFDTQEGFLVGGERFSETILSYTDDAVQSWSPRIPEPAFGQTLFDISFYDRDRGVACGIGGKYLYTLDSGDSWRVVQSQYWRQMQGITFADSLTVIA
ncbi:MAG: hypothetical protein AB8H47_23810, partial [Bacteroidia bacterium]